MEILDKKIYLARFVYVEKGYFPPGSCDWSLVNMRLLYLQILLSMH